MDRDAILQLIARQLLNQRGHLDALAATSGWSEDVKIAYGRASRRQMDKDVAALEPLVTAREEDILAALEELGPSLAIEYLQYRSAHEGLMMHLPLHTACLKFGNPSISWEDARQQTATTSSLFLKNPQAPIMRGFKERLEAGFNAFKNGEIAAADLPYLSSRFYLNGVIRCLPEGDPALRNSTDPKPDWLRLSRSLFAAVIEEWQRDRESLSVDQELRMCALLTFACQELPGYDVFDADWERAGASISGHLNKAVIELEDINQRWLEEFGAKLEQNIAEHNFRQIEDAKALAAQIAALGEHELFANPVQLALRIYDHDETEKLTRYAAALPLAAPSPVGLGVRLG
jgi:hypothetical protein